MTKIDQLIRSNRKTIAIIVRQDGWVIVRAPQRTTDAQIQQFLNEKAGWIKKKQAEANQRNAQLFPRRFSQDENFWFTGELLPLDIVDRPQPTLMLNDGHFSLAKNAQAQARPVFTAWYKEQARKILDNRAQFYAARYHLKYQQIRITSARTRWGSCSSLGNLSFTWRLVMAPLPVIDYVVVHELAHLIEKNHSKRFWQKVSSMYGDYTKPREWLKQNGHRLTLE